MLKSCFKEPDSLVAVPNLVFRETPTLLSNCTSAHNGALSIKMRLLGAGEKCSQGTSFNSRIRSPSWVIVHVSLYSSVFIFLSPHTLEEVTRNDSRSRPPCSSDCAEAAWKTHRMPDGWTTFDDWELDPELGRWGYRHP